MAVRRNRYGTQDAYEEDRDQEVLLSELLRVPSHYRYLVLLLLTSNNITLVGPASSLPGQILLSKKLMTLGLEQAPEIDISNCRRLFLSGKEGTP